MNNSSELDSSRLWMAAIKIPMYSVAVMPIVLGTAIAFADTGTYNLLYTLIFLIAGVLILAWENLTNDVFDADTGIDVNKHHSVVNLTQKKALVFWLANGCLALGLGGISFICWQQQDWTVLELIGACCALGYIYQGPPFRLGYQGLGEILCFFAFGPLAISAVYYSQTQTFSTSSLWLSGLLGLSTSMVLFCSHFHQVEDDIAAGKKSPIVRLGTKTGAQLLVFSLVLFFTLACIFIYVGYLPPTATAIFVSAIPAYQLAEQMLNHHGEPALIKDSKFTAINFHFTSGLLLAIVLWLR
jgi:1,4-dihydroxy-2-naphthoate octaprenyltransferase